MVGVGFDIDHTLVIDNKLERIAMLRMLETIEDRGGTCRNLSGGVEAHRRAIGAPTSAASLASTRPVIETVRSRTRHRASRSCGMPIGFEPSHSIWSTASSFRFRERARCCENLRSRGIRTAVLSNGWNPLQIRKAGTGRVSTASLIASADIGVQKPQVQAFDALVDALGTKARTHLVRRR